MQARSFLTSASPAVLPATSESSLEWHVAQVSSVNLNLLELSLSPGGVLEDARPADGLLIQPGVGDTVIASRIDGAWRVLMVLNRHSPGGAAVLRVPNAGSLRIESSRLCLSSSEFEVHAQRTTARLGLVRLSAQALRMAAHRIAVWADSLHIKTRCVALRADMRIARVDGADVLHAGQLLTEVDDLVRLDGRQVQVGAKENVLIDGKRISLG